MFYPDFNYHTHTNRCGHAIGEDEEYVKEAIKAGIKVLGFSDHAPYKDFVYDRARMRYDKIEDYLSSIERLKDKYKDQIRILIGFETEYFDELNDYRKELLKRCDYLILGQHFTEYETSKNPDVPDNIDIYLEKYCENVIKGIESKDFLYLAHPDFAYLHLKECTPKFIEISKRILKKCEEYDLPIEINLLKLDLKLYHNDGEYQPYPCRKFWELVPNYNVRVIYGYDAHDPKHFADKTKIPKANKIVEGLKLNIIDKPLI